MVDMEELPEGFEVPKYEDMTREELIETILAMEAHHQEHHEREATPSVTSDKMEKAREWVLPRIESQKKLVDSLQFRKSIKEGFREEAEEHLQVLETILSALTRPTPDDVVVKRGDLESVAVFVLNMVVYFAHHGSHPNQPKFEMAQEALSLLEAALNEKEG